MDVGSFCFRFVGARRAPFFFLEGFTGRHFVSISFLNFLVPFFHSNNHHPSGIGLAFFLPGDNISCRSGMRALVDCMLTMTSMNFFYLITSSSIDILLLTMVSKRPVATEATATATATRNKKQETSIMPTMVTKSNTDCDKTLAAGNNDNYDGSIVDVDRIQRCMVDIHLSGHNRSFEWREIQLKRLQSMLEENQSIFQQAITNDLGRDRTEAIVAEIQPVQSEIKYFLQNLKQLMARQPVDYPAVLFPCTATIENVPLPPPGVLIIGPSNYPLNLVLRPLVGVLAGGNPCVIKPSELTPHTSEALALLVPKYFPPPPSSSSQEATEGSPVPEARPGPGSAVQVVLGGPDATSALLERPWGKVLFTGSERVGRIVAKKCAETLTPVCLELGGKCYCIIDESIIDYADGNGKSPSSLISNAADRIVFSKCFNAGQTCVAPDTFVVHESIVEQFALALRNSLQQQFGTVVNDDRKNNISTSNGIKNLSVEASSATTAECRKGGELPRIVTKANAQRQIDLIREVEERIKSSTTSSVSTKIVVGRSDQCDVDEKYIVPTVVVNPPQDSRMMQEEIFGPIFPIVTYRTREEAINIVNSNACKARKIDNDDSTIKTAKFEALSSHSDSIMQRLQKQQQSQIPLYLYVFCTDDKVFRSYMDSCPSAGAVKNGE